MRDNRDRKSGNREFSGRTVEEVYWGLIADEFAEEGEELESNSLLSPGSSAGREGEKPE